MDLKQKQILPCTFSEQLFRTLKQFFLRKCHEPHVAWKRIGYQDNYITTVRSRTMSISPYRFHHFIMFYEKYNYLQYNFWGPLVRKTIFLMKRSAVFDWTVETLVVTLDLWLIWESSVTSSVSNQVTLENLKFILSNFFSS